MNHRTHTAPWNGQSRWQGSHLSWWQIHADERDCVAEERSTHATPTKHLALRVGGVARMRSMSRYTHGHESAVVASHARRTAQNSASYLLPHLEPGMNVLDVGFGPASITLDLAQLVAPGTVTGIENADAPFALARAAAAERGDSKTEFVRGDVMALPFADDTFDVVHAHQVLQHLTDPVGALKEMARVCKPGGLVAARDADYQGFIWYPSSTGLTRWLKAYRTIALGNGAQPDAGRRMRAWANRAGLECISISSSSMLYADAQSSSEWGASWSQRVSSDAFKDQAIEHGYSLADIDEMADAWRQWAVDPDAFLSIPNTELLARV